MPVFFPISELRLLTVVPGAMAALRAFGVHRSVVQEKADYTGKSYTLESDAGIGDGFLGERSKYL